MTQRDDITAALRQGGIIDMTTTGRTSGRPRRIEIAFFHVDGGVYISGLPGKRGWMANLRADPRLTVHLKDGLDADLPATARFVTDEAERRAVLEHVCETWGRQHQLEAFVAGSPLIEVVFEDRALLRA
jgi:deazaflavin-dependent oxidoreductase (nitroreductase family)